MLSELEDMLLRYERQLKQSEGARMAAEQAARSATAAADEARQLLASSGRQAKQRSAHLAVEAEAVQQERAALEEMRANFAAQLQLARAEVAKAQAAMSNTEERVRATEAAERAALIAEYESRTAALLAEVERLRHELAHRTTAMAAEMDRWKQQASLTAAAAVEAKDEVLARKRELDATKDRMDSLVERLYGHREANISLSGAIGAAAGYQQAATESFLQQQAALASYASLSGGSLSGFPGMGAALNPAMALYNSTGRSSAAFPPSPSALMNSSQLALQQPAAASGKRHAADSSKSKRASSHALVPTSQQQRKAAAQQQVSPQHQHGYGAQQLNPAEFFQSYSGAAAAGAIPGTNWPQMLSPPAGGFSKIPHYSAAPGSLLPPVDAKATASNSMGWQLRKPPALQLQQQQQSPQGRLASKGSSSAAPSGSYAQLHQQQHGKGPGADAAARRKQQRERDKPKKPDRFAEGAKNAAMITAMASRW
ncbi:hypothetical protein OEZ86_006246 [Tetradesmus obliquus]|nr:hypothetical protein OEZ86_006246 [Tetradesmus obliquus]